MTTGTVIDQTTLDAIWKEKLLPLFQQQVYSPMFAAIVCRMLNQEPVTDPGFAEMIVTSDGYLMGRDCGDIGFNTFIGSAGDLDKNLARLAHTAELTEEEQAHLFACRPRG